VLSSRRYPVIPLSDLVESVPTDCKTWQVTLSDAIVGAFRSIPELSGKLIPIRAR
jgi:hypothetical protein